MRPWRYVGANPQSWWCQVPNCSPDFSNPVATATHEMQLAKALGAQNIRLEVPWPVIETSSGVYDWSRADALFHAASQVGITIEPVLMWTPQWAGGGSMLNQPPAPGAMQAFAMAFAQRYDRFIRRGVEVWNEPDGGKYLYNGSAQTFVADILNPAYAGIKAADAGIPVIMGGTATDSNGSFLRSVIGSGGRFDIAAFHSYAGSALSEAQVYRSVLSSSGRSSDQIWLGEYGSQSGTSSQVSLIQQVLGQSSPLSMAQWYNLRDTDSWQCCPPSDVDHGYWGLVQANFTPKSSYTTMQGYLGGRSAPPPPLWSPPPPVTQPPSSATSTSTPGHVATSAPSTPSPSASPTASPSPTPSPTATIQHPGAGSIGTRPGPIDAATTGTVANRAHGMPWAPFAAISALIVLAVGGGAAFLLIPGLRRLLPPLR